MKKNQFRLFLIVLFTALAVWSIIPTIQDYLHTKKLGELSSEEALKYVRENRADIEAAKEKRLKLGLDLQGGMHIVLEVDVLGLIEERARNRDEKFEQIIQSVREQSKTSKSLITELLADAFKKENIRMSRYFYDIRDSDADIVEKLETEATEAVNRAREIIRNRVDQYGVAEPVIQTQGGRRIIVELPGVSDKQRVRKLLKGTAKLEFRLVRDKQVAFSVLEDINKYLASLEKATQSDSLAKIAEPISTEKLVAKTDSSDKDLMQAAMAASDSAVKAEDLFGGAQADSSKSKEQLRKENPLFSILGVLPNGMTYTTEYERKALEELLARADVQKRIPSDLDFLIGAKSFATAEDGTKLYYVYPLKKQAELTGGVITEAKATFSSEGMRPEVTMKMDGEGTRVWARVTGANIGKQIAIVLDKTVYSAPVVQSKIPNGSSVINGIDNIAEAQDLEIVLKAGALPAPVKIIEERTVGPSLGADSIRAGIQAIIWGFAVVAIFMVIYYRGAGFIADFALIFNVIFVIAVLAGFSAALTLPGIAGLVLTIGMAVDANVLIFERVREEISNGKRVRLAVEIGYEKAFSAILDSHITTLGGAFLLYSFGIGPIQGFAVTLMIGTIASLFTAVVITKVIIDWMIEQDKVQDTTFG
ncbi:protein-export membrane protein SecD [Chloroherpeton thalassium ATCC 35110]|uniref:Protein translocase subunit SecD n=1 Tax=Chloroherpeton thalassium (strain ATCC 35110 / GB-78) TaxID=517418 RepID=B3QTH7_CHLT3|nr:protein translocase subunit SecD [Chloroherpeton thalassium]ACF12723.1 protein-export membrane protein SecD [Chloroherpeton thalassium ATCC 35110]